MLFPYRHIQPKIHPSVFIAPTASIIGRVELAERVSIWFNTVIRGDINSITVGKETNIQDSCVLHVTNVHPVILGERITVGHGAILHGCKVEDECMISMGAILLDGVVVGRGSLVAAGAVVAPNTQIPANSLVMGIPGKVVRTLSVADQARITEGWQHYVEYAEIYKEQLSGARQD
jgi:gamma-carbonic anhydrase